MQNAIVKLAIVNGSHSPVWYNDIFHQAHKSWNKLTIKLAFESNYSCFIDF